MSTNDLAHSTVGQIAIVVQDLDRATTFYRDTLGLPFLFQFTGLAFFRCGEVRFMLSRPEKPEYDHPGSVLYFKVSGIDLVHQTLAGRGVQFIDAPHLIHRAPTYELWMTFFKDTEGTTLALMEEKAIS
jgi:methylmalonyl-CoA/ethylmalonyl-CoA epimerase